MASPPKKLKIEANGSRLSKLLINKGTQALKTTLQFNINFRSSNLSNELNKPSNKSTLESLRKRNVINREQWNLLYPSIGSPDIENFDISLLTILLRNVCGLTEPSGGWNNLPSSSDTSISANIARIKFYRNKVYGHITTTSVDDREFEYLWQKISKALVGLGIEQTEIDELKKAPLTADEANYIEMLKNWSTFAEKTKEDVENIKNDMEEIKEIVSTKADVAEITQETATKADVAEIKQDMATKADVIRVKEMIQDKICSDLQKLGKCNFNGLIKDLNKKYLEGTREWLFEKLDTWFNDKSENASNVMILIAGPGVGKSVFAAEVCRRYSEKKKLAASHFCRYNRSDERNPRMLIESLASSMCDTISDFKNESQVDGKSELLELIAEEFHRLPKWIKIFITSRPELPVQEELNDMNPLKITTHPRNGNNEKDLYKYLRHQLNDRYLPQALVEKCEGSFLYAYYAQLSLKEENIELTYENIQQLVPSGLSGVYKKQFKRVKELLTKESPRNSIISDTTFMQFLELLAACQEFLPLTLLFSYLGFSGDIKFEIRSKIIEPLSQILPVYDDCLTVYHKSLIDWLKSDGYKQHEFTVNPKNGHKFLWHACEKLFKQITFKSLNIFEDHQMNTPMIQYALKNGIHHMIEYSENVDFSWAVDVKVVYARFMFVEGIDLNTIRSELLKITKDIRTFLRKDVLEELLFHLFMTKRDEIYKIDDSLLICLQSFANRIHGSNERRLLARDLLKQGRFSWFEDLDTTYLTNHHHLTVSLCANVTCLCVSSNEELLAVGYENGQISIFELPEFTERCILDTALDDTRLKEWDEYVKFKCRYDIYDHSSFIAYSFERGNICCCSFSPTGNRLVTSDGSTKVKLWDVNNGRLLSCLQSDDVVNHCSFLDSGLFITAKHRSYSEDVFTAWNSLTLQRIDRRCVVDYQKLQCTDKCSEFFVTELVKTSNVFQFPKAIEISKKNYSLRSYSLTTHHYRDCIYYHTNQVVKHSKIIQFSKYGDQGEIKFNLPFVECQCVRRFVEKVHPISFKEFYVVPYFSGLNIFKTDHLWRPSLIFERFEIKCCCFSPDGSFFAAFAVGDHVNIHIWSIERCTIIQTVPMQLKDAEGCWWSDGLLWIWDGSDHLMKISTSSENFVDSTQAKYVNIGFKPMEILTFGDVLVCKDYKGFVQVVRITKGEIQYNKRLPVDSFELETAAVFPDNSAILTVKEKEYTLWKWGNNSNEFYLESWHTAEIPITALIEEIDVERITENDLEINCGISDSKQAVIVISFRGDLRFQNIDDDYSINDYDYLRDLTGIYVIKVHENNDVSGILHTIDRIYSSITIIHKSYYIGEDDYRLFAAELCDGEICAEFYGFHSKFNITIHSNTGTLALVLDNGYGIQFLRLNTPLMNQLIQSL
ncbi:uncharacterized protein LOC124451658 [Xenia sp. Carnegie-2017]|uniref:uncharacterized protein LOC124451658 n=1 Tax=Xenia sp. Carnegie-2017 TaxID=2897299 RepID=UPI001F04C6A6|nr:uncharacterized protein LOC124451658 [Xenia sp. Carnegie-2017]